jgi:hypothetical protein
MAQTAILTQGIPSFPSPLAGEGGFERSEKRGEGGGAAIEILPPHPARIRCAHSRHPLPRGEREKKRGTA